MLAILTLLMCYLKFSQTLILSVEVKDYKTKVCEKEAFIRQQMTKLVKKK